MDINKLKVPELRTQLKARGLSTTGNRNELLERLSEALQADDENLLEDEDAVLAGEADEALLEEGNGHLNTIEDDAALLKTTVTKSPPKAADEGPKKKVTLNRKPAAAAASAPVPSAPVESSNPKQESNPVDKEEKKTVKIGTLSADERAKLRAQKFGVPISDSMKKAVRAERFGLASNTKASSDPKAVDDKILKRQARFGIVTSTDVDAKKKKRAERFGTTTAAPAAATSTAADELKRKRAERFGLAV